MSSVYRLGLYEKAMPAQLTWVERLRCARNAGFDAVEISIDESPERLARLDALPALQRELRAAMDETGLRVPTMCLSGHRKFPLGHPDPSVRDQGIEIMDKALDMASSLGIRIIQLAGYDVYYEPSTPQTVALFAENLTSCVRMAAAHGVILGFETMETPFMDTIAKAMSHVRRENSPYLQVYPDLGNLTNAAVLHGHALSDDLDAGAGHLVAAHLKESRPGVYRDLLFGQGHVDFPRAAAQFLRLGVRLFTAECWYLGSPRWQDDLKTASTFLRKALGETCRQENADH